MSVIDYDPYGVFKSGDVRGVAKKKSRNGEWCIEGEYVNFVDMGKRLKLDPTKAATRHARECAKPGPVTWAGLGGKCGDE